MLSRNSDKLQDSIYLKMISNIGDVIVIFDKMGINRYKSSNSEKHFGWKAEELIGKSIWELIHPDDLAEAELFFTELLQVSEKQDIFECRYRCKNGTYKWIKFTGINLCDDPEIGGILGNYHDIQERKEAEQSLKESEVRFKTLHNASFGGIFIHQNSIIIDCNQGLSSLSGYTQQELIGMNGLLLVTEPSRELVVQHIEREFESLYQIEGLRKDGSTYPLRVKGKQIPYKNGTARVVEFRDISEFLRHNEEKKQLQKQLQQAQKMESIGRLAGGVAHDFNNMLAVIFGFTELALEEVSRDSKVQNYLNEVLKAADRSMQVTRQLLAFARRQTTIPTLLDINDTIDSMLKMLHRLIGEGIRLNWVPQRPLWTVKMDPSQIDQIMVNLCINARDAIKGLGIIHIDVCNKTLKEPLIHLGETLDPGDYVLIHFSDTGAGMTDEVMENLFEPFFTTKEQDQGTGLGLATVYGIVKQNQGMITVESTLGEGTEFQIYLPAFQDENRVQQDEKKEAAVPKKHQGTILLVEDELGLLNMTETLLSELGYQVLPSSSPKEAIQIAEKTPRIDLLLTDVIMPEMSGKKMAEIIMDKKKNMKVLYMSGYTADIISSQEVAEEGVSFIQKPFTKKQLTNILLEILG